MVLKISKNLSETSQPICVICVRIMWISIKYVLYSYWFLKWLLTLLSLLGVIYTNFSLNLIKSPNELNQVIRLASYICCTAYHVRVCESNQCKTLRICFTSSGESMTLSLQSIILRNPSKNVKSFLGTYFTQHTSSLWKGSEMR